MPEFTRTDRALLIRVGSHLGASAESLSNAYGLNWGESADSKTAKGLHDRLCRDRADLAALRARLEAQIVPPAPAT